MAQERRGVGPVIFTCAGRWSYEAGSSLRAALKRYGLDDRYSTAPEDDIEELIVLDLLTQLRRVKAASAVLGELRRALAQEPSG